MDDSAFDEFKNKAEHPKSKANFLSNLFFCWGLPIFYKGWIKDFNEDDLYKPLKEHTSHKLGDKLEQEWKLERMHHPNPLLLRALWKMFRKEIFIYGVVLFVQEFVLGLSQPLALQKLMSYYSSNQTSVSLNEAYLYAGILILTSFLSVLVSHSYMLASHHLGMKIRIACCSLIYRKSLKLSKTALTETTIGQMINLLSNDVARFDTSIRYLHFLWIAPLETIFIMYLLYYNVGYSSLSGFCLIALFMPLQVLLGKLSSKYRLKTAMTTDERVRSMSEIISGIQVIKMYNWESYFSTLIENIRRVEIRQIRFSSYIRALHLSFSKILTRTSIFLCILTYTLTGSRPNAEFVYVIQSFYNTIKNAMTNSFPQGVTDLAEMLISIKRIEDFLKFHEVKPPQINQLKSKIIHTSTPLINAASKKSVGVYMHDVSAKWSCNSNENTLSKINFSVGPKELVAIVGEVGSGKTSLLHVIMKEMFVTKGIHEVVGCVSYASQEPWLFAGTIRQNILFGEEFLKARYELVIKVCSLERDLEILPFGDKCMIGDRGVTLSGGQRARINLARALYKDADIYLLDDPLSAVDAHVGKRLFENVSEFLKNKCAVLVTHQLQYLNSVSRIYVMENGKITISGTFNDIQQGDGDFAKLFKSQQEPEEEDYVDDKESKSRYLECLEEPSEVKESMETGCIARKVYKGYFQAFGGWCSFMIVIILFMLTQLGSSSSDYFLKYWISLEQARKQNNKTIYKSSKDEDYLKNYDRIDIRDIKGATAIDALFTTNICFYVYSAIITSVILITVLRSITFFTFCMRASTELHNTMFARVINATMRFFNTNCSGRVLNRFSKDLGAVDEKLPYVMIDTMQVALNVIAVTIIIALVDPWIMIPTFVIGFLFYLYRTVFLRTSRNIKRIEATTKSPVFAHINASLQGLTTIRASGAQEILRMEFDHFQDVHSSAFYMFLCCNQTFGFWLDFHCIIYAALVTLSFFFIGNESFGANVGLAITQAMSLTGTFQWGMRQWSELENNMTSVERVVEYTEIEQEVKRNEKEPRKTWPEHGQIEFNSVYLRYASNESYVLNNLTFKISPKQKVGIVGRTGAGKSSIMAALFRLADLEGKILIDGIGTTNIPLKTIRSKISIIPQEPVIFSGTLRSNLDPFNQYSDKELWNVLEEVELKEVCAENKNGLDCKVSEGGLNFSLGQRQLICLARAILANNKILVMDEATANVDPKTDGLIQSTIRRKFADCTVLTIAHRLHTVMDSDKVLVMDAGEAVEFDHPHILLQNIEGVFYGLVKGTGKATAEQLAEIARKKFEEMHHESKKA
ncbi:probable multidrug resistance-associated protein lethal(2)03659 [Anthonomus grandis grandis]|uniref:probable multidrug resistance-associated protein lethal(2)03659 n=1 Tax=Anthonomus grandis grandis TaxID=2921223 RepID=UPI0021650B67|nr:probable multidrug resistance-associated protein lethal(2)03659 [Anthonomus grandis grandis]XP_050309353.1 probable multidrug resistance-associated protein lethal(2)03659 [Anthonomus grandis grandis]XP_050309354.1 probable multidrug resistance-associated protein lethal(2)03659 [Anthonomus grandis grandis]XP_050309356.1 probable multidrug resistance-associated protein lethal(2)03659 [Anthonomus grandis grandis]